ncbi:MAG: hypothetical protein NWF07_06230 [Candidatus Bathyarchaeota archaeon]|nr:hypothetical protein [Candidatus Bathyarchaeota archaeon]
MKQELRLGFMLSALLVPVNTMNTKMVTAGLLLTIGAAALLIASPALAHPYWSDETEESYPWWDVNQTYPMPHWSNGTYIGPRWNNTDPVPYWGEDGYTCPGPIWTDPDSETLEERPWGGYGCGGMRGYGGRSTGSLRGPSRWTG